MGEQKLASGRYTTRGAQVGGPFAIRPSIASGYHPSAAGKALRQSWPAMEEIISGAISVAPEIIWPSLYSNGPRPLVRHQKQPAP